MADLRDCCEVVCWVCVCVMARSKELSKLGESE